MNNTTCHNHIPEVSQDDLKKMSKIFQLLGDTGRLKLVLSCLNSEKTVSQLMDDTGMSQSLTSHQLRALKDARILRSHKDGRNVLYTIDDNHIHHIVTDLVHHILEDCQHSD